MLTRCSSSTDTASHFTPTLCFPSTFETQIHRKIIVLIIPWMTFSTTILTHRSWGVSWHGQSRDHQDEVAHDQNRDVNVSTCVMVPTRSNNIMSSSN